MTLDERNSLDELPYNDSISHSLSRMEAQVEEGASPIETEDCCPFAREAISEELKHRGEYKENTQETEHCQGPTNCIRQLPTTIAKKWIDIKAQPLFPLVVENCGSSDSTSQSNGTDDAYFVVVPSSGKVFLWKAFALGFGILTWSIGFIVVEGAYIMMTFSSWAVALSVIYLCLSWFYSIRAAYYSSRNLSIGKADGTIDKNGDENEEDLPLEHGRWQRLLHYSWLLSSTLAIHGGLGSCLIYWPFTLLNIQNFSASVVARAIPAHGGLLLLVLFDAYTVNRIPVNWIQWFYIVLPYDILYVVWTGIHALIGMGNPEFSDNDPTTNDDAIYPGMIEWTNWQKSLSFALIIVFVVSPIMFWVLKRASHSFPKLRGLDCQSHGNLRCSMGALISRMNRYGAENNGNEAAAAGCENKECPEKKVGKKRNLPFASLESLDSTARTVLVRSGFSSFMTDEHDEDEDDGRGQLVQSQTEVVEPPEEGPTQGPIEGTGNFGSSADESGDDSEDFETEDDLVYHC